MRMRTYPNALRAAESFAAQPLPLLIMLLTRSENEDRREAQRATWLTHHWSSASPWRYVYVCGRRTTRQQLMLGRTALDTVHGDMVTLSAVEEGYDNLVFKTLEGVRWVLTHVTMSVLLKTDDDSMVHIDRSLGWLEEVVRDRSVVYAGFVLNQSEVIRLNMSRHDMGRPDDYPSDFHKWAVPFEAYSGRDYPPYCSGGGYFLGRTAAERILKAYESRLAIGKPVVHVEDAFVGVLASEGGVEPTDLQHSGFVDMPAAIAAKMTSEHIYGMKLVHRAPQPWTRSFEWLTMTCDCSWATARRCAPSSNDGTACRPVCCKELKGGSKGLKGLHRSGRGGRGRAGGGRRGRARGRAAGGRELWRPSGAPTTTARAAPLYGSGRIDWSAAFAPIAQPVGLPQLSAEWVTVGIKHTSGFEARLASLRQVLNAVAGLVLDARPAPGVATPGLPTLVAAEDPPPELPPLPRWVRWVRLPAGARGLSSGRNALAAAATTPMMLLLDDDVMPPPPDELRVLLRALAAEPTAALAGACLLDDVPGRLNWRGEATRHCFVHDFEPTEDGRLVRMRRHSEPDLATGRGGGCRRAHVTHNVFLARTATLRRHPWDDRQEVMEHETFFYGLYLNRVPVVACNNVTAVHRRARDGAYVQKSQRFGGGHFQYLCKNFPEVEHFDTQHNTWYCRPPRRLCQRGGTSEFPFDSGSCHPMEWDERDDASHVARPLLSPRHIHPSDRFPPPAHVPLLMLLLTQHSAASVQRRAAQRPWLNRPWSEPDSVSRNLVPVRYVYVLGTPTPTPAPTPARRGLVERSDAGAGAVSGCGGSPSRLVGSMAAAAASARLEGDMLTLSWLADGCFATSIPLKVLAALRWALSHASFDVVFKADDDTLTHVGRLWGLVGALPLASRRALYGGFVPEARGRQVVRPGMTVGQVEHLWGCHLWVPGGNAPCVVGDVSKYAVPHEQYPNATWPPFALGGPGYLIGVDVVRAVSDEYERRHHESYASHREAARASRAGVAVGAQGAAGQLLPLEDVQVALFAQARGHVPHNLPGFVETAAFQLDRKKNKDNGKVSFPELVKAIRSKPNAVVSVHRVPTAAAASVMLELLKPKFFAYTWPKPR